MPWTVLAWNLPLAVPLALALWALARPGAAPHPGWRFLGAVGWVVAWVLPVVALPYVSFASHADGAVDAVAIAPMWTWVCLGGWSVQGVFEATVEPLFGSCPNTLSFPGWYLALAAAQVALLALLVGRRRVRGARWTDPVLLLVGALALANAFFGANWPWYGT